MYASSKKWSVPLLDKKLSGWFLIGQIVGLFPFRLRTNRKLNIVLIDWNLVFYWAIVLLLMTIFICYLQATILLSFDFYVGSYLWSSLVTVIASLLLLFFNRNSLSMAFDLLFQVENYLLTMRLPNRPSYNWYFFIIYNLIYTVSVFGILLYTRNIYEPMFIINFALYLLNTLQATVVAQFSMMLSILESYFRIYREHLNFTNVESLITYHEVLCSCSELVNLCFGPQIFFIVSYRFILIICHAFFIFRMLPSALMLFTILFSLCHGICIFYVVTSCGRTENEVI